jgi:putative inorganic carbon (HCO3(-)) transporter
MGHVGGDGKRPVTTLPAYSPAERRLMAGVGSLVVAGLLVVPFAVTPTLLDAYRVLKESLARSEAILAILLIIAGVAFGCSTRLRRMLREGPVAATLVAAVTWTLVTTLLSTHRILSVDSYVTCVTSALLFLAAWFAAPRISLVALDLLIPVVLINTVLVGLQEYGIYDPFPRPPDETGHVNATGFIDNPNVVGAYMTLVAILLAAAAMNVQRPRRLLYLFGASTAVAGVLVSGTRSALIALVAGFFVLAVGRSVRRATLMLVAVIALFATGALLRLPAVTGILSLPRVIATGSLEQATSYRVAPVLAAFEMFRDRPLLGVGPGAFKFQYLPYKARVLERYPDAVRGTVAVNFGEVHNDHAQLLAENGLPGYLIFLAAVVVFVRATRGNDGLDSRQQVATAAGIVIAVTLLVLAIAQFPLYVPATRHLLMTVSGLLVGWSRP